MSAMRRALKQTAAIGLATVLIAACSGGGGGGSPPASPLPPNGGPPPVEYTPGVFDPAASFKDQCEAPRSGVDIEGVAFPDEASSLLEELFWLRSWTFETYLWNREAPDLDPNDYDDRITYFDLLKTSETTPSGEDKDDFHFSEPTEDYLARQVSAGSASYGASFAVFASTPPRDVRVRYTDPDTPASEIVSGEVNLVRGARILAVDGVDLVNDNTQSGVDTLNAGLVPASAGESHTFEILEPGATESRTVTLVSEIIAEKAANRTEIISTPSGDVGYILINTFSPFSSEQEIADAMEALADAGVDDLVVDLRYNGGGLLAIASQLAYMIAGQSRTTGRTFEQLEFNEDSDPAINPVTGERNDPIGFYSTGLGFSLPSGAPLSSLDLDRVYILSTEETCSASEAVINGLRGIDIEIVLIGDVTCGKPYGFYPADNCGETYYTIQFRGVNDKDFGDYTDGFIPDNAASAIGERLPGCVMADDYDHELGDEDEALLDAALQYREDGTCPSAGVSPKTAAAPRPAGKIDPATGAVQPAEDVMSVNRDMRMPH